MVQVAVKEVGLFLASEGLAIAEGIGDDDLMLVDAQLTSFVWWVFYIMSDVWMASPVIQ